MSETQKNIPADWYDDGSGNKRWWDGHQWGAYAPTPPPPVIVSVTAPAIIRWSGPAITGMILGIVALIGAITFSYPVGWIFGVLGLLFGIAGTADRRGRRGKGMGVTGIVLSGVAIGFLIIAASAGISSS